MNYKIFCIVLLNIVLFSGCANLHDNISSESQLNWEDRQTQLHNLKNWEFNGRIAVQIEQQNWFANLFWQQQNAHYRIKVSGPMGQGAAHLEGDEQGVKLIKSDKTEHHALNAEELLANHLGWQIPINGLLYWIKGLPNLSDITLNQLDSAGHLIKLSQDNWNINFENYVKVNSLELPKRLILERPAIIVKIIIEQWRIN